MRRGALLALVVAAASGLFTTGCGQASDTRANPAPEAAAVDTEGAQAEPAITPDDAASAEPAVAEFAVDGMTCGGCALATEMAVKKLVGVASADADYDEDTGEGSCRVKYDPSLVSIDSIARAIRGAGFEPRLRRGVAPTSGPSPAPE